MRFVLRIAKSIITLFISLFAFTLLTQAQDDLPPLSAMDAGLNIVRVPELTCARGDPYSFVVRPGDPRKLAVFFAGGGTCWSEPTCNAEANLFADRIPPDELITVSSGSVLDAENPLSPLRDYSLVAILYCTGDLHAGEADVTYGSGADAFTIHHFGAANAQRVLDWVMLSFPEVDRLFVGGSSAGAYGALYHAPTLLSFYPETPAVVFADAGLGVVGRAWQGMDTWNVAGNLHPTMASLGENGIDEVNFVTGMFTSLAQAFPNARLGEYSTAADSVQILYYNLQFDFTDTWLERATALVSQRAQLPNYRIFVAEGDSHSILSNMSFSSVESTGMLFHEWFAALFDGPLPRFVLPESVRP